MSHQHTKTPRNTKELIAYESIELLGVLVAGRAPPHYGLTQPPDPVNPPIP
jgi:hypothetical protein